MRKCDTLVCSSQERDGMSRSPGYLKRLLAEDITQLRARRALQGVDVRSITITGGNDVRLRHAVERSLGDDLDMIGRPRPKRAMD
jgi:hypothetical protein